MATRGVQQVFYYRAWDSVNNVPKTGDVANHHLFWDKDGTNTATSNSPSEVSSGNCPGRYKVTLTATECDCLVGDLQGNSTTSGIYLFGVTVAFEQIPNAVPGAAGGLFIAGSNAATTVNVTGNLSGSVGSVTGAVGSVTGAVGSVTGNVGGNVVGTVASVVTPGNIWDVTLASHITAGSTGAALNNAGVPPTANQVADAILNRACEGGSSGSGTAGEALGMIRYGFTNNLDGTYTVKHANGTTWWTGSLTTNPASLPVVSSTGL